MTTRHRWTAERAAALGHKAVEDREGRLDTCQHDEPCIYWDGRFAQDHSNHLESKDVTVGHVYGQLMAALGALSPYLVDELHGPEAHVLPSGAADAVREAFEAISGLDRHLPLLYVPAVVSYESPFFERDKALGYRVQAWCGFLNRLQAEAFLPGYKERYPDRKWGLETAEVRIRDIVDPTTTAEMWFRKMGRR